MNTRNCEFCKNHTPEYLEEFYHLEYVCPFCDGTKELNAKECFCAAWDWSECCCGADWSDVE